ncbi:MAG: FHA domain-containing protein [Tepidisphaeraceae bacterium]
MISIRCQCGHTLTADESKPAKDRRCPECGQRVRIACAETLPAGAGEADFDAVLVQQAGPAAAGQSGGCIALGGCAEISIGRLPGSTIELPGQKVSRQHAKLIRVDFGPSRWKIADAGSSAGLFVNGQRIEEHDLEPGDTIVIGEYKFKYTLLSAAVAGPAALPAATAPYTRPAGPSFWTTPKIVGAAVGGVVVVLIVLVLAVLVPAFSAARGRAQSVLCASQLRQIGNACAQYQQQFGKYPPTLGDLAVVPGISGTMFICPGDGGNAPAAPADQQRLAAWINQYTSYTYSGPTLPGGIVAYEKSGTHEAGLANALRYDGGVDRLAAADLQRQLSGPPAAPAVAISGQMPTLPTAVTPALSTAKARAQGVLCGSQLRQIGNACAQYQQQYGSYPAKLGDLTAISGISGEMFICPGDKGNAPPAPTDKQQLATWINQYTSYTYSGPTLPGGIVAYEKPGVHEAGLVNVLLADGAVDRLTAADLQRQLSGAAAAPAVVNSGRTPAIQVPNAPAPTAPNTPAATPRLPRPPLSSLPTITLPARMPISLADARKDFKTRLTRQVATADPVEKPPVNLFRTVQYNAPPGKLAAYLTPDPNDGAKHPAIIWITGGDCNSVGDVWTAARADNDQTAAAYRKAGMIMMFPSLRGGNGNPGHKEGFYGEVDDVLAAADYLAVQPYVDPSRIYLGGHSTGGTLALLVAECSDRFRAVISFGPVNDVKNYGDDTVTLPFDKSKVRELQLRAPGIWLDALKTPTFVFEGDQAPTNKDALYAMVIASTTPKVQFFVVKGKSHFTIMAPTNQLIADKIKRDIGPTTNLAFAANELPGMTPIRPRDATTYAKSVTMAVTGKPVKEPAMRVSIDRMAWDLERDDSDNRPRLASYAGKYLELRGMVDSVETEQFAMPHVEVREDATGRRLFNLFCYLAKDPLQLDLADDLTPGQEVLICGTFTSEPTLAAMNNCTIIAVGSDPALPVSAEQLCKDFAADAKQARAKYTDKVLLIAGTVRQVIAAGNQVFLEGGEAANAIAVQALVFRANVAAGQKVRIKAKFSDFRDNRIVVQQGRILKEASSTGAAENTPLPDPALQPVEVTPTPAARPSGVNAMAMRLRQNASAIIGTEEGNPGSYRFPLTKQFVGINYSLTKGAGPKVLRYINAFTSQSPLPARDAEQSVRARDGYVVHGLIVDADKSVNAIRIIFVRLNGDRIVPGDTYTSDWLGTPQTDKPTTLDSNGRRVVGVVCYEGDARLNAIGLALAPEK